jgi:hypothetical protein
MLQAGTPLKQFNFTRLKYFTILTEHSRKGLKVEWEKLGADPTLSGHYISPTLFERLWISRNIYTRLSSRYLQIEDVASNVKIK